MKNIDLNRGQLHGGGSAWPVLRTLLALSIFLFSLFPLYAQQYPVRLVPVVVPPYSMRLSDYATGTDTKLQLQVLMADLNEPQHQVGIRFWLEAGLNGVPYAQSSDFVVGLSPFTLFPGNTVTLGNVELRALFELRNLSGIGDQAYARPLPEGLYRFCFQAYDYQTRRVLSARSCAAVFLVQYDPPILNLPQRGEKVQAPAPGGILFQWMPRQLAPNTRYTLTLKELWDPGQDPVSGFLSSPPLWQQESYAPMLHYGMDKPQLVAGRRYGWQVQARSGSPVIGGSPTEDNGAYKNNGLSEIYWFDYVENCRVPSFPMARNSGTGRTELSWMPAGQPVGQFRVQYRKRGSGGDWVAEQSERSSYTLTGLEEGTEYEYRIGTVCGSATGLTLQDNGGDGAYSYTAVQYFATGARGGQNGSYQCGTMPVVDIANRRPLQVQLVANEVFMAGDFPVTVIQAEGNSGSYSGTGYIQVPYLADTRLKVAFSNIQLNTDRKLIGGVVETTYDIEETNVVQAREVAGLIEEIIGLFRDVAKILGEVISNGRMEQQDYDKLNNSINKLGEENGRNMAEAGKLGLISPAQAKEIAELQEKIAANAKSLSCAVGDGKKKGAADMADDECIEKAKVLKEDVERQAQLTGEVNTKLAEAQKSLECDSKLKLLASLIKSNAVELNFLKLLTAEEQPNTKSADGKYSIRTYSGTGIKIVFYESGWPEQIDHLFRIELSKAGASDVGTTAFWLYFNPNDITSDKVPVTLALKDTMPLPGERNYCYLSMDDLPYGISAQAAFSDMVAQQVFLTAEIVSTGGALKAGRFATGAAIDLGLQLALLDIIKTSLGQRFTTTDLLAEVSWPSVLYGGLTYNKKIPIVVNVLGSFTVGFADALAREAFREKSAKNLNLAQASYEGFKQALITAGIEATLRLVKLPARYNRQQVEDAFKRVNQAGNLVRDIVTKRVIKTVPKWDNKLGKLLEYPKYNNVALGKSSGGSLKQFGDDVGANVWTSETDNVFTLMYDLPSSWTFERSIVSVFDETIGTNGGKILFDISGVNIQKGITGGMIHNQKLVMQGFVTELELQMLLRNRGWYNNVIFHEGGKVLSNQELVTKSLNFIGQ